MPRKGRYHYYEEVDDAYDYDEDYDYAYENTDDASVYEDVSETQHHSTQPEIWNCPICTYNNIEGSHICVMCGVFRNVPAKDSNIAAVKSSEVSDPLVKGTGIWHCAACTYENLDSIKRCEICETEKASSQEDACPMVSDAIAIASTTVSKTSKSSTKLDQEKKTEDVEKLQKSSISSYAKVHSEKQSKKENETISKLENSKKVVSDELQNLSIDKDQKRDNVVKKNILEQKYNPNCLANSKQLEERKSLLHLAIVGHVDAGKSTLTGRLLHLMGRVSDKEMHKYEREAKQKGKESFAYAWVLDESSEERQRGVTMTVAIAHFHTEKFHVVLLDSPGHKDFVPNMISGASQADAAVLVIDASIGAFEAGMDGQGTGGQTKEHVQLVRSFGVDQLIIAVNKMDTVTYSHERFETIKTQLGQFLKRCGFKEASLRWVPLSVIENQNLVTRASDKRLKSWYTGPNLLEAIDLFKAPVRDTSQPLRFPISEVVQSRTVGQAGASGKLESGTLKVGAKVMVMPSREEAIVKAIERDREAVNVAIAGDNVDIGLQGIDSTILMAGGVLCHPEFPVPIATRIELKVAVLDIQTPILCGGEVELHAHHAKEAARIQQISAILDPKTGSVRKKSPRLLTANQNALLEVRPYRPICVEEYSVCRPLGRVTLRSAGKTIAVGVITRIIEQQ